MSHQGCSVTRPKPSGCALAGSDVGNRVDSTPSGTCVAISVYVIGAKPGASHSISTFGDFVDYEVLYSLLPLARVCVCVNKREDIVVDIFLLPALVVQRYTMGCKRLKTGF